MTTGLSEGGLIDLKPTVAAPDDAESLNPNVRRVAIGLAFLVFGVPILLAGFVVATDPYYLYGAPSWHGFNLVRPIYEPYVVSVKPYQIWRMRPQAVVLGGSSPEVGIDPRHPGWERPKCSIFPFHRAQATSPRCHFCTPRSSARARRSRASTSLPSTSTSHWERRLTSGASCQAPMPILQDIWTRRCPPTQCRRRSGSRQNQAGTKSFTSLSTKTLRLPSRARNSRAAASTMNSRVAPSVATAMLCPTTGTSSDIWKPIRM
jgi:hypothetical protein